MRQDLNFHVHKYLCVVATSSEYTMIDTLPQETFQQVLCSLGKKDLKALRRVNVAFAHDVSKALFRSIDISCWTLHRLEAIGSHPILRHLVEDIYYHEMEFDIVGYNRAIMDRDLRDLWQCRHKLREEDDIRSMKWHSYESVMPYYRLLVQAALRPSSSAFESSMSSSTLLQQADKGELFQAMMISLVDVYDQNAKQQELEPLMEKFCRDLPLFPMFRRFVSVDGSASETSRHSPFAEGFSQLDPTQELFPLSDSAIRQSCTYYMDDWPGHGLIAMLATLNACPGLKIQHLEMYRPENLFSKRGVADYKLEEMRLSLEIHSNPRSFQNLETLKLSLETSLLEHSASHFVPSALAIAGRLKVLDICLTARNYPIPALHDIVPIVGLPSLHTVVFEGLPLVTSDICKWLFLQSKLRILKLRSPRLEGRWSDFLDILSQNTSFRLECFELKSPWDHDNLEYEDGRREHMQIPSRVRDADALHFINEGGQNPFKMRRWRKFEPDLGDEDLDDNLSDYSDLSEWLSEDHPTPVEDPDGLEYDSDYDPETEQESEEGVEE